MKKKKKNIPVHLHKKKRIEHYNEAEGGRFTSPTNVQIRMTSPWCASCFTEVTSLYLGDPIAIQDPATTSNTNNGYTSKQRRSESNTHRKSLQIPGLPLLTSGMEGFGDDFV